MQELPNAMNVLAPDCGSWGVPARGTSRRNWMNFVGMVNFDFVRRGNQMVSRCFDCMTKFYGPHLASKRFPIYEPRLICLCLVILARRAIFVLENPQGSLIYRHFRFEWLCNTVAYVFQLHIEWMWAICNL
jgi:hypothetical protein